jgi:hypothetical protein
MEHAFSPPTRRRHRASALLAGAAIMIALAGHARACDGKSYSLDAAVGEIAAGGGLAVQVDRLKLYDNVPDKYVISVKDDNDLLADHVVLTQYETLSFKTRCGTVSIGADRKSVFHHSTLTIKWSYF